MRALSRCWRIDLFWWVRMLRQNGYVPLVGPLSYWFVWSLSVWRFQRWDLGTMSECKVLDSIVGLVVFVYGMPCRKICWRLVCRFLCRGWLGSISGLGPWRIVRPCPSCVPILLLALLLFHWLGRPLLGCHHSGVQGIAKGNRLLCFPPRSLQFQK